MRFKPMPKYQDGALLANTQKDSPVGKMFIQPQVKLESDETVLLDEVIGNDFAIIAWGGSEMGLKQGNNTTVEKIGCEIYPSHSCGSVV